MTLFKKSPCQSFMVTFILLFSISTAPLAELFELHPNSKGLMVEAPRPEGYTSLLHIGPNNVFQWFKESGKGESFWLQLSIYDFPTTFGTAFKTIEPLEWAKVMVPEGSGNIVSAARSLNDATRFIEIVYDHDLNVANQKWRNRNSTRTFMVGGHTIFAECIVAKQFTKQGAAPPASYMARLRLSHTPECQVMLNGLRVSE